jgi:hypothetical protein
MGNGIYMEACSWENHLQIVDVPAMDVLRSIPVPITQRRRHALRLPLVIEGIMDASATRRFSTPVGANLNPLKKAWPAIENPLDMVF